MTAPDTAPRFQATPAFYHMFGSAPETPRPPTGMNSLPLSSSLSEAPGALSLRKFPELHHTFCQAPFSRIYGSKTRIRTYAAARSAFWGCREIDSPNQGQM